MIKLNYYSPMQIHWHKIETEDTYKDFWTDNPSCIRYPHLLRGGGGGRLSRPPYDLEHGRLYKLQLLQTISTIYET